MARKKLRPAQNIEVRQNIKDSKFFGSIFSVSSREKAEMRIDEIKAKYDDATHNVSAFRVEAGQNEALEYFDDDGEPAGSSGPPVLEAIKGADLLNTVIIVTRYFGGTKLGIGGLIRAYGGTARLAIQEAGIEELDEFHKIEVEVSFDKIGIVLAQLEALEAEINESKYSNQGAVAAAVIGADKLEPLKKRLKKKTAGDYELKIVNTFFK